MRKTSKILSAVLAFTLLVSVAAVASVSVSAEESWTTVWDATSTSGTTNSYNAKSSIDASVFGKSVLKVQKTDDYNGTSVAFNITAGTLNGATKLRVWLAGDAVTVGLGRKVNVGLVFTDGTVSTAYAVDCGWGSGKYALTTTGDYYTIDLATASFYTATLASDRFYSDTGTYVKGSTLDFSKVTKIIFGAGLNTSAALPKTDVYYIDDIQAVVPVTGYTASFSGTAETVADISGTTITLPAAGTVSGKIFAGWSDGSKLYAAGDEYTLTANTAFKAVGVSLETVDGASVRWSADNAKRGLKFETRISIADFDALKALGAVSEATVGVSASYASNTVIISNDTSGAGVSAGWYTADDEHYIFCSSVTNYTDDTLITTDITAKSYISVTYADGDSRSLIGATSCTRNMRSVATDCLNDTSLSLTAAQVKVLKEQYGATEK